MFETVEQVYKYQREYFSRPGAVLAKEGSTCMYRVGYNADGPGCAVGCMIPNELYHDHYEDCEGQASDEIWHLLVEDGIITGNEEIQKWISTTQALHDDDTTLDATHFVKQLDNAWLFWKNEHGD
jgi:hypothetical protein